MKALLIDARREGYTLDQCHRTMTVGELIELLSDYDEDREIYLSHDNGYTYGSITEDDFTDCDEPEETY